MKIIVEIYQTTTVEEFGEMEIDVPEEIADDNSLIAKWVHENVKESEFLKVMEADSSESVINEVIRISG